MHFQRASLLRVGTHVAYSCHRCGAVGKRALQQVVIPCEDTPAMLVAGT